MLFLKYLLYSAHLSAPGNARLRCPQAQDNAEVSENVQAPSYLWFICRLFKRPSFLQAQRREGSEEWKPFTVDKNHPPALLEKSFGHLQGHFRGCHMPSSHPFHNFTPWLAWDRQRRGVGLWGSKLLFSSFKLWTNCPRNLTRES